MLTHGAREPICGDGIEQLEQTRRRVKRDYELGLALGDSCVYDAMYLVGRCMSRQLLKSHALPPSNRRRGWVESGTLPRRRRSVGPTAPFERASRLHGAELAGEMQGRHPRGRMSRWLLTLHAPPEQRTSGLGGIADPAAPAAGLGPENPGDTPRRGCSGKCVLHAGLDARPGPVGQRRTQACGLSAAPSVASAPVSLVTREHRASDGEGPLVLRLHLQHARGVGRGAEVVADGEQQFRVLEPDRGCTVPARDVCILARGIVELTSSRERPGEFEQLHGGVLDSWNTWPSAEGLVLEDVAQPAGNGGHGGLPVRLGPARWRGGDPAK
jgi:hypothetical protein